MDELKRGFGLVLEFSGRDTRTQFNKFVWPVWVAILLLGIFFFGPDFSNLSQADDMARGFGLPRDRIASQFGWLLFQTFVFIFLLPLLLTVSALVRRIRDIQAKTWWIVVGVILGLYMFPLGPILAFVAVGASPTNFGNPDSGSEN